MNIEKINEMKSDPRLVKSAAIAGCSVDEFLARLMKNTGTRVEKTTSVK